MSNCIHIKRFQVNFKASEIDAAGLKALCEQATYHPDADSENTVYWFLQTATTFYKNGGVLIEFGMGRSTHTFRDFEQTLMLIKPFVKNQTKFHVFSCEDDGFPGWFDWKICFAQFVWYSERQRMRAWLDKSKASYGNCPEVTDGFALYNAGRFTDLDIHIDAVCAV